MQDMNMLVLMEIVENQDVELGQRRCVGGRGRGTERGRWRETERDRPESLLLDSCLRQHFLVLSKREISPHHSFD